MEEGIGNYMDTRGILVVNARSKNKEQVKKKPEDVADIINSRVQLYLDER